MAIKSVQEEDGEVNSRDVIQQQCHFLLVRMMRKQTVEKTKYMSISCHRMQMGWKGDIKIVAEFKYLSITATNQDWICKKLKANKIRTMVVTTEYKTVFLSTIYKHNDHTHCTDL
jgi:hypothetical protein